ncbi:hypothetical protein [Pseudomonas sp. NPDC089569]|uniref:hypothetical protein n=1 Tax=Pseudomonas sp. NPDC089569 TaxID=3390722 RepID=UPI003D002FC1
MQDQQVVTLSTFQTIIVAAFACFMAYYGALLIDHLYMVNGKHYPDLLSHKVTVASEGDNGISGLTELCHRRGGWDFFEKDNGTFMRCSTILSGSLAWPTTYKIENYEQLANERSAFE